MKPTIKSLSKSKYSDEDIQKISCRVTSFCSYPRAIEAVLLSEGSNKKPIGYEISEAGIIIIWE